MGRIVRGLMANDTVKLMAITGKDICETARELHGLKGVHSGAGPFPSHNRYDGGAAQGRKRQAHHHNQRRRPGG